MKKAITAAIAASVLMIGCTNQSTEVRKLQAENDSLLRVNAQTTADFNEMIQLMNEVEDGFRQIKEAENYLVTQKDANGEVSLTTREQIKKRYDTGRRDFAKTKNVWINSKSSSIKTKTNRLPCKNSDSSPKRNRGKNTTHNLFTRIFG